MDLSLPIVEPIYFIHFFSAFFLLCIIAVLKALDHSVPGWVFVSAFIGGTTPFFAVLPGCFEIIAMTDKEKNWSRNIEETLLTLGYVPSEFSPPGTRYRSKQPHWFRWKENEFFIKKHDGLISVNGPMFTLRLLQKKLSL